MFGYVWCFRPVSMLPSCHPSGGESQTSSPHHCRARPLYVWSPPPWAWHFDLHGSCNTEPVERSSPSRTAPREGGWWPKSGTSSNSTLVEEMWRKKTWTNWLVHVEALVDSGSSCYGHIPSHPITFRHSCTKGIKNLFNEGFMWGVSHQSRPMLLHVNTNQILPRHKSKPSR